MEVTRHCINKVHSERSKMMKKVTHVILARHGETEWNASEIFRGRVDVPLNKKGEQQAQYLGEYLSGEKIDVVYSSPLKRAATTAGAIASRQSLTVSIAPALIDMNYGEWQGLASGEVQQKYPEVYPCWLNTPEQALIPGGESLENISQRALPFLLESVKTHPGKKLVLVSHRVIHKVLICALLKIGNQGFYRIKLDTAGITSFELSEEKAVLVSHNDTSFLKRIGGPALADF
jgi:phosphoserine phosphatase